MNIQDVLSYEKYYDFEKYPIEAYEELVVMQLPHERKFEILGAWKTGCLKEDTKDHVYVSKTMRKYSFTYRWKYEEKVARRSWEYISSRKNVIKSMMPEEFSLCEPEVFTRLIKLQGIGFVYAAFVMHCLSPEVYPLFDQHVMRAYRDIENKSNVKPSSGNYPFWEWNDYVNYKNFFEKSRKESGLEYWRLDRALWSYGKFIKNRNMNVDYGKENENKNVLDKNESKVENQINNQNKNWCCSHTLGVKKKEFFWELNNLGLTIKRYFKDSIDIKSFSFKELDVIQDYMKSGDWMPLANNVEKLGNGTEIWGVGRIISDELNRGPSEGQLASQISALFANAGIWEYNGKTMGMMFRNRKIDWETRLNEFYYSKE